MTSFSSCDEPKNHPCRSAIKIRRQSKWIFIFGLSALSLVYFLLPSPKGNPLAVDEWLSYPLPSSVTCGDSFPLRGKPFLFTPPSSMKAQRTTMIVCRMFGRCSRQPTGISVFARRPSLFRTQRRSHGFLNTKNMYAALANGAHMEKW